MQKFKWKHMTSAALAAVLLATQSLSAMPALAAETDTTEEETTYVYGTVDLPYADYYYGELYEVTENNTLDLETEDPAAALRADGYYDAVTSATTVKSVKYDATYYTENEDGTVTVNGIGDVNIAVESTLYEAALEAIEAGETSNNQVLEIIGSMTVNEDQSVPSAYKILNGDGTLGAMIDSYDAVEVSNASITVETNTTYGNYEITITEAEDGTSYLPDSSNMEGAIITMTDGSKYAMLHVDNLWLRTNLIAWAVEDGYVVHNQNTLKYLNFTDTVGKTIASVRYIIRDGADVTYTNECYLPVLHDGTVAAESVAIDAGAFAVTLTDLPEDYVADVTAAELPEATYVDGSLRYDTTGVLPGSYTVDVTDANGYYAPISTSVILTTDNLPAAFDEESNTVIAAADADETDFANYMSNISTATVNGTSYSLSGHGSVKILDTSTGELDLTLTTTDDDGNTVPLFETGETYEIAITATGYTEDLIFSITIADAEATTTTEESTTTTMTTEEETTTTEVLTTTTTTTTAEKGTSTTTTTTTTTDEALTTTTTASATTETETTTVAKGDVDGDGEITIADASFILSVYANRAAGNADFGFDTEDGETVGDVDADGEITLQDASYVLQYYANQAAGNTITWAELIPSLAD